MPEMTKVFNSEALTASGTATSDAIGSFGVTNLRFQYAVTGTGTVKLELLESVNSSDYVTNASAIGTTLSGSGLIDLAPKASASIKIKATEDGGAAAATLNLWLLLD